MTNKITAQDILIAHVYLCDALKLQPKLMKPKVLKDIESQLNSNLNWFGPYEVAAYVGMQVAKLKPFDLANGATAAALAMAITGAGDKVASSAVLNSLKSSSVVDEVADSLVLVNE